METTDFDRDPGSGYNGWSVMVYCLIGLPMLCVSGWLVWSQAALTRSARPVQATVLKRGIEVVRGEDDFSDTFRPRVLYRYVVDRVSYESQQVTPFPLASSEEWASAMLARVPTNDVVTAYYDPNDPSTAYLVREVSFLPYLFLLVSMVILWGGLASLAYGRSRDELRSARITTFSSVAWLAGGAGVAGHYFITGGGWNWPAGICFAVCLYIGGRVLVRGLGDWKWFGRHR